MIEAGPRPLHVLEVLSALVLLSSLRFATAQYSTPVACTVANDCLAINFGISNPYLDCKGGFCYWACNNEVNPFRYTATICGGGICGGSFCGPPPPNSTIGCFRVSEFNTLVCGITCDDGNTWKPYDGIGCSGGRLSSTVSATSTSTSADSSRKATLPPSGSSPTSSSSPGDPSSSGPSFAGIVGGVVGGLVGALAVVLGFVACTKMRKRPDAEQNTPDMSKVRVTRTNWPPATPSEAPLSELPPLVPPPAYGASQSISPPWRDHNNPSQSLTPTMTGTAIASSLPGGSGELGTDPSLAGSTLQSTMTSTIPSVIAVNEVFVARYAWDAQGDDELTVRVGDQVLVVLAYADGWCAARKLGSFDDRVGALPSGALIPLAPHSIGGASSSFGTSSAVNTEQYFPEAGFSLSELPHGSLQVPQQPFSPSTISSLPSSSAGLVSAGVESSGSGSSSVPWSLGGSKEIWTDTFKAQPRTFSRVKSVRSLEGNDLHSN
ncbi:hypothetical protein M427DRAFT_152524 [Gonapodya prolifera JEL478]|uniref:SH3 domain-containing protein n=1 Tax=Gonapodya prolifera (strain JEL478) TaxID=1344416 RepID=A0A139ASC4_GONPJ|nr:hypothetical protein M427DRAFT_152524 [Gonapodya prolifera JEL478]|eukprot:KXS19544.1 hypothetical protein M427DRAFT_152524 [Gonapodya prolifera JEL478]